jgi:hypothetical protein
VDSVTGTAVDQLVVPPSTPDVRTIDGTKASEPLATMPSPPMRSVPPSTVSVAVPELTVVLNPSVSFSTVVIPPEKFARATFPARAERTIPPGAVALSVPPVTRS